MTAHPEVQICTTLARERAQQGALFVDLRPPGEAQALALVAPEVVNLPMAELAARYGELPRECELVLVCRDGRESEAAAAFLRERGYPHARPMRGGVLLWMQKGYPVLGRRHEPAAEGPLPKPSPETHHE